MKEKTKSTIMSIIKTLDSITVTGKNNMSMVLGCILALESLLAEEPSEE